MAKTRQQKRQELRKGKQKDKGLLIYALIAVVLTVAIGVGVFLGTRPENVTTSTNEGTFTQNEGETVTAPEEENAVYTEEDIPKEKTLAQFTMENGESFTVELYPEYAPQTVANFVKLVKEGFYDGLTFHRVVEGFMAQGGAPQGTGMGGSAQTIKGEFASNGFTQNTLSHQRGVISMARSSAPDSASSQFFICYDDASFLDGNYAAFGKVVEGMTTIDNFLKVERGLNELGEEAVPKTPIVIKKAVIVKQAD